MQWKCYFTNRYKVAILIELHCSGKKRLYRRVVLACVCVSVSGVCVCGDSRAWKENWPHRRVPPTLSHSHWQRRPSRRVSSFVQRCRDFPPFLRSSLPFYLLLPLSLFLSLSISPLTNRNRSSYDRPFVSVRVYVYRVCVSDNMIGLICMCKLAAATWLILLDWSTWKANKDD